MTITEPNASVSNAVWPYAFLSGCMMCPATALSFFAESLLIYQATVHKCPHEIVLLTAIVDSSDQIFTTGSMKWMEW